MSTAAEWPVTVQWARLMLRPLVMSDRGEWDRVRYRNREWLEPWEASNPEAAGTAPSYRSFVRQMRQQARAGQSLPWLITELDPVSWRQELVGQLTVSGITLGSFRSASLGYWVDGAQAGRGIAPMAVAMATDYCFHHLRLHRMEINIRPENAKSLRVVEKLGFRDEGLRERFLHIMRPVGGPPQLRAHGRGGSRRPRAPVHGRGRGHHRAARAALTHRSARGCVPSGRTQGCARRATGPGRPPVGPETGRRAADGHPNSAPGPSNDIDVSNTLIPPRESFSPALP